jgi:hypothetical protein
LVPTFLDNEVISRAERNIQNNNSIREWVFACFHWCGSAFGWPQENPRRASFSAPHFCVFLVGGSGVQKTPFPLSTSYTEVRPITLTHVSSCHHRQLLPINFWICLLLSKLIVAVKHHSFTSEGS